MPGYFDPEDFLASADEVLVEIRCRIHGFGAMDGTRVGQDLVEGAVIYLPLWARETPGLLSRPMAAQRRLNMFQCRLSGAITDEISNHLSVEATTLEPGQHLKRSPNFYDTMCAQAQVLSKALPQYRVPFLGRLREALRLRYQVLIRESVRSLGAQALGSGVCATLKSRTLCAWEREVQIEEIRAQLRRRKVSAMRTTRTLMFDLSCR